MRDNKDQKNPEYEHYSRSEYIANMSETNFKKKNIQKSQQIMSPEAKRKWLAVIQN